jgi:hypothetical protein
MESQKYYEIRQMEDLIGSFLEEKLKRKLTTNYGVVATTFALPDFDGLWASHPLRDIFEAIDQQDANANRPFRTSVVIGVRTNSPGSGLLEALERLKGIEDPVTPSAREGIWLTELNAAYAYPW